MSSSSPLATRSQRLDRSTARYTIFKTIRTARGAAGYIRPREISRLWRFKNAKEMLVWNSRYEVIYLALRQGEKAN
jgi:hypothetical protein